jgi:hypothetical protein
LNRDDTAILAALEALDAVESPGAGSPRADETAETLTRLYTEVLGLVPFALDPVAPRPEVKAQLMEVVTGRRATGEHPAVAPSAVAPPAVLPEITPVPEPAPPLRSSQEVRAARPVPTPTPAASARGPVRPSRWPLAMAATLALLFLGSTIFLYLGLVQQGETISRLSQEVQAEKARASLVAEELARARTQLDDVRDKFSLVTSRAVEISPMRPVGEAPLQPEARGMLFVAADHQHWHLSLEGLQPAESGKVYKLWFIAEGGPIAAGSFTAEPGKPMEMGSDQMPAGTRSAMVTLEEDPDAAAPAGPEILRAAAVYQIS